MNTVYLNRDSSKSQDDAHSLNELICSDKNFSSDFKAAWNTAYQHYCLTQEAIVLEYGSAC